MDSKMKISAKKKGAIYQAIREPLVQVRRRIMAKLRDNPAQENLLMGIEFDVAQIEVPIYQAIIKELEEK